MFSLRFFFVQLVCCCCCLYLMLSSFCSFAHAMPSCWYTIFFWLESYEFGWSFSLLLCKVLIEFIFVLLWFFCCCFISSVLFVIILPHALNSKLSKETNIQLGAKDSHNLLFWCIFEIVGGLLSLFMVVNHLLIVNYFRFFNLAWTVCDKLFKKCEHSRIYWVKWRRAHARGYGYGSFQFVVYLKLSSPQWTKLYQVRLPWFCRQKMNCGRNLKECSNRARSGQTIWKQMYFGIPFFRFIIDA